MNSEFSEALDHLVEEKGLDKKEVLKMIEASLAAAFRKDYGEKDQNIEVELDPETMGMRIFDVKEVVEDVEDAQKEISVEEAKEIDDKYEAEDEVRTEITPKEGTEFGRIAAQTAKQVIIQKLREAERDVLFTEFKAKERQIVTGVIQRMEGKTVLVDLGRATGALFPSEQIKDEDYRIGQRIKVLILHVEPTTKGPKITLSRSHPDMVRRLFELEVPEIHNGTVEIKEVAREAGARSKIAVWSNEEGIDPIGACVGQRGSRVQTVMGELNGEKIDIIEWDDDPVKFISNALSPAKILNVELDEEEEEKKASVGVMEDQLSLAIGKAGQNVRLAARLTGWKIDIFEEKVGAEDEEEEDGPQASATPEEEGADEEKEDEETESDEDSEDSDGDPASPSEDEAGEPRPEGREETENDEETDDAEEDDVTEDTEESADTKEETTEDAEEDQVDLAEGEMPDKEQQPDMEAAEDMAEEAEDK